MVQIMPIVVTGLGVAIFIWRLWSVRSRTLVAPSGHGASRTSIIVPARNEESNLPALLDSLAELSPPPLEIIVVDDHSDDKTGEIARQYSTTVVTPEAIPPGWIGKSWACHTGALKAQGDYLLFTDADTVHAPDSLGFALDELERTPSALVSYIPTHILKSTWEQFQGVYQLLLLVATKAGSREQKQKGSRRFAIGQYLLFSRSGYDAIGGHKAVAHRLSEDLALGSAVADAGLGATVLIRREALKVRMYPEGLWSFIAGWRRSFRDGIGSTGLGGGIEMMFVVTWLLGVAVWTGEALFLNHIEQAQIWLAVYLGSAGLVAFKQREVGDFSPASAFVYPIFVLLFILVSMLVLVDAARGKPITWRGREINLSKHRDVT